MLKKLAVCALVTITIANYSSAICIEAKARLAQILIQEAWAETLATGEAQKPWSWADTWPVARLRFTNHEGQIESDIDLYILEGAEGNSLAFGPGHHQGTDLPGYGASIVGGHRDTHFEFLKEAQLRDELQVQRMDGQWKIYEIQTMEVRNSETEPLLIDQDSDALYLVTCYPFDAIIPGGPLRYLVVAKSTLESNDSTTVAIF